MRGKADKEYWTMGDGLIRVAGWARDGLTNEDIYKNMGISFSTFRRWRNDYEQFAEALKKGRDVADRIVENALYKRATGYFYEEVTKESVAVYDETTGVCTGYEMKETKRITRHVPPDTTAQIYWLKNRKPYEWRDKRPIEDKSALAKLDAILVSVNQQAQEQAQEKENQQKENEVDVETQPEAE